ncbi:MAG: hypothetical protein NXI20_02670 [bacterium]|nr:hypothetical protein [bacterium]
MFETSTEKSLDESVFDQWLEDGKNRMLGEQYMLVIWNELELEFSPMYVVNKSDINTSLSASIHERILGAYDLYSGSRIPFEN